MAVSSMATWTQLVGLMALASPSLLYARLDALAQLWLLDLPKPDGSCHVMKVVCSPISGSMGSSTS